MKSRKYLLSMILAIVVMVSGGFGVTPVLAHRATNTVQSPFPICWHGHMSQPLSDFRSHDCL